MPPDNTTQDPNLTNNQQTQPQGGTPASWDEWLNTQPEEIKTLYNGHITGLKNTVQATRQERDDFAKQVKELAAKADKGSDLEKSLTDLTARLEASERRAAFLEDAAKPEIGCRNPKAAYALAQAENLFSRNGAPDWNAIKAAAPELFGAPAVQGNAGSGTQQPPQKVNMNDVIRRAAGRS